VWVIVLLSPNIRIPATKRNERGSGGEVSLSFSVGAL